MSRPAVSKKQPKKRALSDEESEEEVEVEAEELAPARSVPLAGLVHKRARKTELEKLAELSSASDLPDDDVAMPASASGRSAKQKSGLANRDPRTARQRGGPKPVAVRPHYQPIKDKYGRKVWKGSRSGLDWFDNVGAAMASIDDGTCKIGKGDCTGDSEAIDHVKDFATEQTTLETELICDGDHHWKAIMLADAQQLYNGGFDTDDDIAGDDGLMAKLGKTFVWSCTHCNSSKGGKKGLDGGAAIWQQACPGEDDCDL